MREEEVKSFGVNVCCCGEREAVATLVRSVPHN